MKVRRGEKILRTTKSEEKIAQRKRGKQNEQVWILIKDEWKNKSLRFRKMCEKKRKKIMNGRKTNRKRGEWKETENRKRERHKN